MPRRARRRAPSSSVSAHLSAEASAAASQTLRFEPVESMYIGLSRCGGKRESFGDGIPCADVEARVALAQRRRAGPRADLVERVGRRLAQEHVAPVGGGVDALPRSVPPMSAARLPAVRPPARATGSICRCRCRRASRSRRSADGGMPAGHQRRLARVRERQVAGDEQGVGVGWAHGRDRSASAATPSLRMLGVPYALAAGTHRSCTRSNNC